MSDALCLEIGLPPCLSVDLLKVDLLLAAGDEGASFPADPSGSFSGFFLRARINMFEAKDLNNVSSRVTLMNTFLIPNFSKSKLSAAKASLSACNSFKTSETTAEPTVSSASLPVTASVA